MAEIGKVEAEIAAMRDVLGQAAPDRRRLLQAVTGKAVGEVEIGQAGRRSDDGVAVEPVHVIGAGPGPARPDRFEGGDAMGQRRPDRFLEERPVDILDIGGLLVPIGIMLPVHRRGTADEHLPLGAALALRPAIGTGGVDQQRAVVDLALAGEGKDIALLRRDRDRDAGRLRQSRAMRAGGVDHRSAGDAAAIGERDAGDPPALDDIAGDLALAVFDTERARLPAEGLEQGPAVEPALAADAIGAAGEIRGIEPAELGSERFGRKQGDVGALDLLQSLIGLEHRSALTAGDIEIAALVQIDGGYLAIDGETGADIPQEADAEERDADVDRARELLADRGCGQSRSRIAIGRVLLDHHDLALEAGIGGEMIGDGGADGGATDNHDIGGFRSGGHSRTCDERGKVRDLFA